MKKFIGGGVGGGVGFGGGVLGGEFIGEFLNLGRFYNFVLVLCLDIVIEFVKEICWGVEDGEL